MAKGSIHTVYKEGSWVVEIEGPPVTSAHRRKREALSAGRQLAIARKAEHVIHNLDGTIAERSSYGRGAVGRGD